MTRYPEASAHGRFQPLHLGHMEYLLAAKARCEFLWIGITQVSRSNLHDVPEAAAHRADLAANPLTFFERVQLVREAMLEVGVQADQFAVLPFPIETPSLLAEFLPKWVPVLTTVYDEWNEFKVQTLRALGYPVEVLWERSEKTYEGARVRSMIASRDLLLREHVPNATMKAVDQLRLHERL